MDDSDNHGMIDAGEATRRLRVSFATLYSYVSRGLIHSEAQPGNTRTRLYSTADIERLIWQKTLARKPAAAAATALSWGLPVLETRISQIQNGMLTYRGRNILELADTSTLEDVAMLLWNAPVNPFAAARFTRAAIPGWSEAAERLRDDPVIDRAITLMSFVRRVLKDADDSSVLAAQLVQAMAAAVVTGTPDVERPLHEALAACWHAPAAADIIRRVLVCCAEHELNTSSFSVRVAASTDVDLATCLLTGLTAYCGYEHSGVVLEARELLRQVMAQEDPTPLIASLTQTGVPVAGFFHRLYPDGDPRAREILSHLSVPAPVARTIEAIGQITGLKPNIELALVIVEQVYRLPVGAAEAMFITGRSVGWISHAMEQKMSGIRIRPRASAGR
ncbi:citrate/2-methylcitrate synthase [Sodalis endosymbiont of Spalangia cameroni]|uniref:citrate/2-methylcitrate synthase n=1 Tax=Sodalis praecaptivus TaxID=1239307 RepID=UPI0031F999E6